MKKVYKLQNLDCANCAAKMENAIAALAGIERVSVNFMTQRLRIEVQESDRLDAIMQEVVSVCRRIEPDCKILC